MTISVCGYHGGKNLRLSWLLPLLPDSYIYLEPFFGMGSVFLNRRPMSKRNILNDKDENIQNLFETLRDQPSELEEMLELTLNHRKEFLRCKEYLRRENKERLEWARATLVVIAMGMIHTTRVDEIGPDVSPNNYVTGRTDVNRMRSISGRIKMIAETLNNAFTVYESMDAIKMLKWYFNGSYVKDTLIYLDPPYVYSERGDHRKIYGEDSMNDDDHMELLEILLAADVKVAISGYPSKLYDQQLKDWWRDSTDVLCQTNGIRTDRIEMLWRNYDLSGAEQQKILL